MGVILLIVVMGLSIGLPVKCYNDGQYKIKCMEMHGRLKMQGPDPICDLPDNKSEAGEKK